MSRSRSSRPCSCALSAVARMIFFASPQARDGRLISTEIRLSFAIFHVLHYSGFSLAIRTFTDWLFRSLCVRPTLGKQIAFLLRQITEQRIYHCLCAFVALSDLLQPMPKPASTFVIVSPLLARLASRNRRAPCDCFFRRANRRIDGSYLRGCVFAPVELFQPCKLICEMAILIHFLPLSLIHITLNLEK